MRDCRIAKHCSGDLGTGGEKMMMSMMRRRMMLLLLLKKHAVQYY